MNSERSLGSAVVRTWSMNRLTSAAFAPGVSVAGMISSVSAMTASSWRGVNTDGVQVDAPAAALTACVSASARACAQRDWTHSGVAATPTAPATSWVNARRRVRSVREVSTFHLLREVIGSAPRERQNGEGRVLFRCVGKSGSVHNEDVLDLVHLVERGERRALRVRSHPAGAVFVNRRSHRVEIASVVIDQHAAGSLDDLLERVGHVLGHLPLVLTEVIIDVQQRHAVSIDALRIDGDAVVRVRKRLTERMDLEPRGMAPLDLPLERGTEPGNLVRSFLWAIPVRPGVPELRAESTQVVATAAGAMVESRHINVFPADAAIVPRRRPFECREISARVQPDLFAQVAADHVGSVAEPIRVGRRFRVQQNACRIDAARAKDHDLAAHLLF